MFDEAFGEITEAKRSRSWQAITDCLNEHTNAAMTVMTVRTMYKRAKKVLSQKDSICTSGVNAVNLKKW